MDLKQKTQLRHLETGRRRGTIICLLYENRPSPISFAMLWQTLDSMNMPLTCRQFSEKLQYLRGDEIRFINVFKLGDDHKLSGPEQERLIQTYCDQDGEGGDHYFVTLSTRGVNFQEGQDYADAHVSRVH